MVDVSKLAVDGGAPVACEPFPHWPHYGRAERQAVDTVLRSGRVNYWTGDDGRQFEQAYAGHTSQPYAVSLANGTLALQLALHALRVGPGIDVLVTPRSFVASASCVALAGARAVFADVDRQSGNLTVASLRAALTADTQGIIVVHLAGWPCDMPAIMAFAREHGLWVVEDCAQAHGAAIGGRVVGSFGDIAVFSFCQDKIITTGGEGGMLLCRDEELWRRAWSFKDHGKNYTLTQLPPETGTAFRWLHDSFGSNYRMTGIQAAIGIAQLDMLDSFLSARQANATSLSDALRDCPGFFIPMPGSSIRHAWYKLHAYIRPEALLKTWDRSRILQAIKAEGVPCFGGSCGEIYLEKCFEDMRPRGRLPVARDLGETSLMFPVHPGLLPVHMQRIADAVHKVMRVATGCGAGE